MPGMMVSTCRFRLRRVREAAERSKNADDCAKQVFQWMTGHLVLTGSKSAYRLPMRGDLDPLTVLKGGRGSEIDLTIFGVAALRSCGVAARLVWAAARSRYMPKTEPCSSLPIPN